MKFTPALLTTASIAALADAHGYFTSPKGRQPGPAYQKSCGAQAFYQMSSDINGNIQGLLQTVSNQPDYDPATCHLWKCKGMKYADNTANVQHYTPGQIVPLKFNIAAPHDGYANISIISLAGPTGTVIASNLKKWSKYALTSTSIPVSEESFSIKMPTSLGSKCAQPGSCAIQMFWNAPSIDQTYESCIDFTLSRGSSKRGEMELERAHPRDFVAALV